MPSVPVVNEIFEPTHDVVLKNGISMSTFTCYRMYRTYVELAPPVECQANGEAARSAGSVKV